MYFFVMCFHRCIFLCFGVLVISTFKFVCTLAWNIVNSSISKYFIVVLLRWRKAFFIHFFLDLFYDNLHDFLELVKIHRSPLQPDIMVINYVREEFLSYQKQFERHFSPNLESLYFLQSSYMCVCYFKKKKSRALDTHLIQNRYSPLIMGMIHHIV